MKGTAIKTDPTNDGQNTPDPSTSGDDRNLVTVAEHPEIMTFEDKVFEFWNEHRRHIFLGIGGLLLAIVAYQAALIVSERREMGLRAEYGAATDDASRIAFATSNPDHPLAGWAHLQVANTLYAEEKYTEAKDHFAKAASVLKNSPAGERAELGEAMAILKTGGVDDAKTRLQAIAGNVERLDTTRGEASYTLAVLAWEAGDFAAMNAAIKQIEGLEFAGIWQGKSGALRESEPALRDLENANEAETGAP